MGLSSSKSSAATSSTAYQTTTTGSSGDASPTINAGGGVTYEDAGGEVSLASLAGMQTVINRAFDAQTEGNSVNAEVLKAALERESGLTAQSIEMLAALSSAQSDSSARAADNSSALLQDILKTNSTLAENQSSGGATLASAASNKIVWGLIALVAFFLWTSRK